MGHVTSYLYISILGISHHADVSLHSSFLWGFNELFEWGGFTRVDCLGVIGRIQHKMEVLISAFFGFIYRQGKILEKCQSCLFMSTSHTHTRHRWMLGSVMKDT